MSNNHYTFEIGDYRVLHAIFEEDSPAAGARALKLNWVSPVSNCKTLFPELWSLCSRVAKKEHCILFIWDMMNKLREIWTHVVIFLMHFLMECKLCKHKCMEF